MARFFPLPIADIRHETNDCVSIALDVPGHLRNDFRYKAGQYITFRLRIGTEEIRRSYSLCSSPETEQEWRIAVKKVSGGKGSVFLNEKVKIGDIMEVMAPEGNFTAPFAKNRKVNYVLFAGGSGITPIISIIKTVLDVEPESTLTLFYGNRDLDSVIFRKQLDDLASAFPNRFRLQHILEKTSGSIAGTRDGRLDRETNSALLREFAPQDGTSEFFICGPAPMMEAAKESLKAIGVGDAQIHIEYFSSGPSTGATGADQEKKYKNAEVTIICDGDEVHTTLQDNESVLEAALRNNLDAPYACQGGSCCTCRAKLLEGSVEMKVNYALLESEVKEGFILTCQSYALTDKLVVDYDRGR